MNNIIYQCRVTNLILIDVSTFLKNGDNGGPKFSQNDANLLIDKIMKKSNCGKKTSGIIDIKRSSTSISKVAKGRVIKVDGINRKSGARIPCEATVDGKR